MKYEPEAGTPSTRPIIVHGSYFRGKTPRVSAFKTRMKLPVIALLLVVCFCTPVVAQTDQRNVIPRLEHVRGPHDGRFEFHSTVQIVVSNPSDKKVATILNEHLSSQF